MNTSHGWLAFVIGAAIFAGYEIGVLWVGWRHPDRIARSAHAFMRASGVDALALMGAVSLASCNIESATFVGTPPLRIVLEILLMATLFASFVCSAMAMRYFSQAGFVMSMPVAAPERVSLDPMAKEYVKRAGLLYSWALRFFLIIAPLVVGLVRPLAMPSMTVALIGALRFFDRPARQAGAIQGSSS